MNFDYDQQDQRLIHALLLDGRASFSRLGAALGVSDRTVARRYARLRETGRIRVSGRTDPALVGEVSWFVRIHCVPSVALAVARALAKRPDTTWVKITSGGTEIVCVVRAATGRDSESLLLDKLPRTPNVVGVTANCLLHVFYGGPDSILDALTPAEASLLRRPVPAATQVALDDGDRRLIALLEADGRRDYTELAAAVGRPQTTVRRRIAELRATGALYFDVDIDYAALGYPLQTMLWLAAAPDRLLETGQALAAHPEVPFVAATTGTTNLYASVLSTGPADLFTYLSTKVAALPATQRVETAPVIRTVKSL